MHIKKIVLSILAAEMALMSSHSMATNYIAEPASIDFQHQQISSSINELKNEVNNIRNTKLEAQKELEHISIMMEEVETEIHSNIDRNLIYQIVDNAIAIYGISTCESHHEIMDYELKLEIMGYVDNQFGELNYRSNYFNIYDITQLSELTAYEYDLILNGSKLEGKGYIFENIEKEYGVNGLFILAIAKQESGLGSSNIAMKKNNLTGYMAYDENTGAARNFVDFEDCLMTTARAIKKNYLQEDGKYYHGKSIFSVNVKYCSQIDWSIKLIDIMYGSVKCLLQNNI